MADKLQVLNVVIAFLFAGNLFFIRKYLKTVDDHEVRMERLESRTLIIETEIKAVIIGLSKLDQIYSDLTKVREDIAMIKGMIHLGKKQGKVIVVEE